MSKHTPGPWEAGELCYTSGWVDICQAGKSLPLASTRHTDAMANAALIAAAPDLLAALDRAHLQIITLLNEGDFKRNVELDLGYIVDAIAKAQGRS